MSTLRRSPVSWGDLLRYLAKPGAVKTQAEAAKLLGLHDVTLPQRAEDRSAVVPEPDRPPAPDSATHASSATGAAAAHRMPLRCPQGFAVRVEKVSQPPYEDLQLRAWEMDEAQAVERMLDASGKAPPTAYVRLDPARARACMRAALRWDMVGDIDVAAMVDTLARNEWPAVLPRCTRRYRARHVHLCMDMHPDRQFLLHDYLACRDMLSALSPATPVTGHGIDGPWRWAALQSVAAPGQTFLFLAEPRLMPEADYHQWRRMQSRLRARGAVVLWPLEWLPQVLRDPASSMRDHSASSSTAALETASDPNLDRLLAALSPAATVEPALIRAMAEALGLQGGLRLEQAVWCHPDLDGALPYRQWYADRQRDRLHALNAMPIEHIATVGEVLRAWHAHRHRVQRDQELLCWADAVGDARVRQCGRMHEVEQAVDGYTRVARHLSQLSQHAESVGLAHAASPGVIRAAAMDRWHALPESLGRQREAVAELLLQAAAPTAVAANPATLQGLFAHESRLMVLRQQGHCLLLAQAGPPVSPGAELAEFWVDNAKLVVECDGTRRVFWGPLSALSHGALVLAEWGDTPPQKIRVSGALEEVLIDTVARPHWAAEFAQQRAWAGTWVTDRRRGYGMGGLIHWPDGSPVALDPTVLAGEVFGRKDGWLFEMDRYGPRLSFDFMKGSANPELRTYFRYIPPGTFLQGSPKDTGDDNEHPQHPVTLTQGLWLAETPCTQALWQAVMGKNPSHFKDGEDAPRRPVESVSWDDVTSFLQRLQPLLPPGCEAVLPTESQWEYACRAGTQTEYWWGDEPDASKANLDVEGNRTWNDQDSTTPVDRYPPNPWGLYDLHGNVWEWCGDGTRDYAAEPARDPEGPGAGDLRVVSGGSWIDRPGFARAAYRFGGRRVDADRSLGFRFALRSPSGPEARPGGLGARRGGAAGGRTDGADDPPEQSPPEESPPDFSSPEGAYE